MTFTDILTVIWRRKWIILAVTILASAIAVGYLQRLTPSFESSTTLRVSPLMTEAVNTGMLAGIAVDVDPSVIGTPAVLEAVEKELGVAPGSIAGSVSQAPVESATTTTAMYTVTASADSSPVAQRRAATAAAAYSAYLEGVMASTQKTLSDQLAEVSDEAKSYQNQVDDDPTDQLAQTNLTTALARVNALNASITSLQTAGPPTTITAAASAGASTNPTTLTVAGVALASGLLAGLGLALTRDRLDTRIRRAEEIENATRLPVLAQLPSDRRAARDGGRLPADAGASTPLSEGLRSLRTTLQIALPQQAGVLVVTSVEPGDGKTFVSANLAASWARTGRRVVLVAGDLRRPSLDAYFPDSTGAPGLGGLLCTSTTADDGSLPARVVDALQPTPITGLTVLPAGELSDDPADALATSRMGDVLRTLRENADIVIVDTPPALALADASMVAAQADGTIVIAAMHRTKSPLLTRVITTLTANGAVVLGTVANKSRQKLPRSYTSYYVSTERPRQALNGAHRATSHSEPARPESGSPVHRDRVLIVCTANESRSPVAAAMLRAKTRSGAIDVDSAGTDATGRGASPSAVQHAAAAGLDLSTHTSTQVDPASLTDYDVILTLTRSHARTLLASTLDVAPRLFTVRQFARWIEGRERPEGIPLGSWLDDESDQSGLDFLGENPEDDIDDPTGRTASRWKRTVTLLDEEISEIAAALVPGSVTRLPVAAHVQDRHEGA